MTDLMFGGWCGDIRGLDWSRALGLIPRLVAAETMDIEGTEMGPGGGREGERKDEGREKGREGKGREGGREEGRERERGRVRDGGGGGGGEGMRKEGREFFFAG